MKWLPGYALGKVQDAAWWCAKDVKHIYFCICDHFEPYWRNASEEVARKRISRWTSEYPKIAQQFKDAEGYSLKYSFFYPEEEYRRDDMDALAEMCLAGYGEVEIHLHHDNDTPENFKRTIENFKRKLHEEHGLLSVNKNSRAVSYGFIHGNWALNNSRPDKKHCGIDNEIPILIETGCYADFTFPSAPSNTQTKKINSIYYAVDAPGLPKAHDWGVDARVGDKSDGLLMVQGPLCLDFSSRKYGVLPRIENGGILGASKITKSRVMSWMSQRIHVKGAEEHVFIKIYTHGTQESVMKVLFDERGFELLFEHLISISDKCSAHLHFTSAREMVNIIKSIESGEGFVGSRSRNFRYLLL